MVIEKIKKLVQNNSSRIAYKHNRRLFHKFYKDMDRNYLPHFHDPTKEERDKYGKEKEKKMMKLKNGSLSDNLIEDRLYSNYRIPIEIDIWVDKVFEYYFHNLEPMRGLVHWTEGARKRLYESKGYKWYGIDELHVDVIFD